MLNEVSPKRIVTTCPHCLHTLKNEYPDFGGNYNLIHHTQLINELVVVKKLKLGGGDSMLKATNTDQASKITFHDPCYLARQSEIIVEPRQTLRLVQSNLVEMPRNKMKSFCCGAGGAQMWKEEEEGEIRVSEDRFREAQDTGAEALAVSCPFCMIMLTDAQKSAGSSMQVLDIAEIVASQLQDE
jgi:Fe-S oxidoreductase